MNGDTKPDSRCATAVSPLVMGAANRRLNDSALPSTPGMRKSKMLHSSDSRFSMGVPVSANRTPAGSRLADFAACVLAFLMYCASSSTTQLKSSCS